MPESDEELYRLMRKGSQEAFAALYQRREPALYRYALHISGSTAVAEEVAGADQQVDAGGAGHAIKVPPMPRARKQ